MAFAQLLRDWKSETGWTEADIAKSVGVSRAAVNQWLNQAAKPSLEQLPALGKLLKVDWHILADMVLELSSKSHDKPMAAELAAVLSLMERMTPDELQRAHRVLLALDLGDRK